MTDNLTAEREMLLSGIRKICLRTSAATFSWPAEFRGARNPIIPRDATRRGPEPARSGQRQPASKQPRSPKLMHRSSTMPWQDDELELSIKQAIVDGVIGAVDKAAADIFRAHIVEAWTSDRLGKKAQELYSSAVDVLTVIEAKVCRETDVK